MARCVGKPWSIASRRAKASMCDGKHPTSGAAIGNIVCLDRFFKYVEPPENDGLLQCVGQCSMLASFVVLQSGYVPFAADLHVIM